MMCSFFNLKYEVGAQVDLHWSCPKIACSFSVYTSNFYLKLFCGCNGHHNVCKEIDYNFFIIVFCIMMYHKD